MKEKIAQLQKLIAEAQKLAVEIETAHDAAHSSDNFCHITKARLDAAAESAARLPEPPKKAEEKK